jgi:predicted MFS family arabinose efflux permease
VIPLIAADFGVEVRTAALLSTVFTLPYAIVQPLLGMLGDFFGKTRMMNFCLLVVALAALVCALTTSFALLVGMRIVAGLVAGGVFPVALALVGDLVPVKERQVGIARILTIGLTGNLLGASIAGVIGDVLGWRGVFAVLGAFGLIVAVIAYYAFRNVPAVKPAAPFNLASAIAGFRGIFADPRAKVCFGAVFLEAIFIQGLFPYVAILLLAAGEARASIAGVVIAAFGVGGVAYTLVVSKLVTLLPERRMMVIGGTCAAIALALAAAHFPWYGQIGTFGLLGFGFYLLHGSIQVHVTELSPTARGAAASLHSCSFYLGQATGPVVYAFGFATVGEAASLLAGAVVVLGVGLMCARLLRHRVHAVEGLVK